MTPRAFRMLRRLADGRPVSGTRLAEELGVSRAAVWKMVDQLRRAGLPVSARSGEGYRLPWPIDPLDADAVRATGGGSADIEVVNRVDSTNAALLRDFGHRRALLAEYQDAGRGQRGRGWMSPPACGLWFSLGYRFDFGLARLGAMSLVAGVAAAEALSATGAVVRLKWPNDLLVDDRKLGGLLLEARGASGGPCEAVIGVGVNVRLPRVRHGALEPDQPWTDLNEWVVAPVDRSRLAGRLVAGLVSACERFASEGFQPFRERWRERDALAGRSVRVQRSGSDDLHGRAEGVTDRGELIVRAGSERLELASGDVRVRLA